MLRLDSKVASPKLSKPSEVTEPAVPEERIVLPAPQQVTPSKRKGLGSLFSGLSLFTGGQQALNFAKPDQSLPSKNSVMGAKAQDRPPEKGVKKADDAAVPTAEVGLGISNDGEASVDDDAKSKKKKKAKKKTRGKRKSAGEAETAREGESGVASLEPEPVSTPTTASIEVPGMFRFGEDDPSTLHLEMPQTEQAIDRPAPTTARAASVVDERDDETELEAGADGSDASSRTASLGRNTPSSEMASPTISGSGKKLPSKPPGNGHLVEAKAPKWKHKKRVVQRRPETPPPETEVDIDMDEDVDEEMNSTLR